MLEWVKDNIDKLDWTILSSNINAIDLLRDNKDKDNEIEYGTDFLSNFDIDLISMFNE